MNLQNEINKDEIDKNENGSNDANQNISDGNENETTITSTETVTAETVELEVAKSYFFVKKMASKILPTVLVVIVLTGVASCYLAYNIYRDEKFSQLNQIVNVYSGDIRNVFDSYFLSGKRYSEMVQNYQAVKPEYRRRYYSNLTKLFLEHNPLIHSFWVAFDSNAFDGFDYRYSNVPPYSKTGRFWLLWHRENDKSVVQQSTLEAEIKESDEDFLRLPRELKRVVIIEPYFYDYDLEYSEEEAQKVLMTSIGYPIFDENKNVVGVAGVDILMEEIVNSIKMQNPYEISYISLASPENNILSHYDSLLIGKHFSKAPIFKTLNWNEISQKIKNRETFNITVVDKTTDTKEIIYFTTVELGETGSFLTLKIVFNYNEIMIYASDFVFDIAVYFAVGLILVACAILFFSVRIYNSALSRANAFVDGKNIV